MCQPQQSPSLLGRVTEKASGLSSTSISKLNGASLSFIFLPGQLTSDFTGKSKCYQGELSHLPTPELFYLAPFVLLQWSPCPFAHARQLCCLHSGLLLFIPVSASAFLSFPASPTSSSPTGHSGWTGNVPCCSLLDLPLWSFPLCFNFPLFSQQASRTVTTAHIAPAPSLPLSLSTLHSRFSFHHSPSPEDQQWASPFSLELCFSSFT